MAVFTEEEQQRYTDLAGMVINGNEARKKALDASARLALEAARVAMPDVGDDTLISFFSSIVTVMARVLATPMQSAVELVEGIFDNYVLAAAHLMQAYDLDGTDVPKYEPPRRDTSEDTLATTELDELINRQYMLRGRPLRARAARSKMGTVYESMKPAQRGEGAAYG